MISNLTQDEINNIHKQNEDIQKNQALILEKTGQIAIMEKKD
jgi:hypothetical protein